MSIRYRFDVKCSRLPTGRIVSLGQGRLAKRLVLRGGDDLPERIEVLHLHPVASIWRQHFPEIVINYVLTIIAVFAVIHYGGDRHVQIASQAPLLHPPVARPHVPQQPAYLLHGPRRLVRRTQIGMRDHLNERASRSVVINVRFGHRLAVIGICRCVRCRFAGVLLQLDAFDPQSNWPRFKCVFSPGIINRISTIACFILWRLFSSPPPFFFSAPLLLVRKLLFIEVRQKRDRPIARQRPSLLRDLVPQR
mmetsp:Transcript_24183/g.58434  ORF Transcript_24183/g.58434 Transcript_24183/m.58434 type:complete len:250 (-) Transcript_24183:489-1238(-)